MANARFESIWKIMSDFNLKFNKPINNDLICSICKKIMIHACNGPCGCRFCLKCISTYLNGKENFCPNDFNYCKEELMKISGNIFTDQAINVRITNLIVNCPFSGCQFQKELREIDNHIRMCEKRNEKCPYLDIGCNEENIGLSKINDHLSKENYSHTKLLFDYINNLKNEMESLKEENRLIKEDVNNIKINTEQLIINVDQLERTSHLNDDKIENVNQCNEIQNENLKLIENKITKLTGKMKLIGNASTKEKYGELEWTIENFSEKLSNARNGIYQSLYSNSFYTHKQGYKMCLRVDPDGYKDGAETHISIYFCIMQGAHDNLLSWPFKADVTLSLMNQQTNMPQYNSTVKYEINKNEEVYKKPINERNTSLGYHRFLEINRLLENSALIHDDQIVVKCTVQILQ